MEPAGLAVGIAGLAGLVSACADCFELLHASKNIGDDYETAVLKLDLIQLRYTRWVDRVGIQQDDGDAAVIEKIRPSLKPGKDITLVENTLKRIDDLFQKSRKISEKSKPKRSEEEAEADFHSQFTNKLAKHLHEKMRKIVAERRKKPTLSQRLSWALYRRQDLEQHIENITELVTELIDLVPAKGEEEQCRSELADMDSDEDVAMLDKVLSQPAGRLDEDLDSVLRKIVAETIEEKRGAMDRFAWKHSRIDEGAQVSQGRTIDVDYKGPISERPAEYLVEDSYVGKNATFRQGDSYGVRK